MNATGNLVLTPYSSTRQTRVIVSELSSIMVSLRRHIPATLDWVATEPDHSMHFCIGTAKSGYWHVTFAVTRPMKVLYFDGSSVAKLPEGTLDAQDFVAWSKMKPSRSPMRDSASRPV
ncbi:hypothetical protein K503DRAFT_806601 [Rhizopogon vinicolor AM-OR11-026]|uniref:Uncharacterized protein n=1 Tax=Rhizopogon vinicolor AM-OR11-026 TaxID=1314800 RepID=A0A1B7ME81_9AGAM|nr:hypothetical protein K503DRAFT_806601 [Rhizopogon vinicolor AM-OR11-026]